MLAALFPTLFVEVDDAAGASVAALVAGAALAVGAVAGAALLWLLVIELELVLPNGKVRSCCSDLPMTAFWKRR